MMQWSRFRLFLKKHWILLVSLAIGCLGRIWGIVVGLLTGFFIETIVHRKSEIDSIARELNNPAGRMDVAEPFEGASLCAALTFFCSGSEYTACSVLKSIFPEYGDFSWEQLCRAAGQIESINADLVAECLASVLRKADDSVLTEKVFRLLTAVEFGWRDERGTKPSEYIASLLAYTPVTSEYEKACTLLGVPVSASMMEIKKAYRSLSPLYHPDTTGALSEEQQKVTQDMFRRVQEAYDLIRAERKSR